mmetsp:Transcript_8126/g.14425  ORF Transcript_8126/g.14425 Transcript_8126/m.14425 type:complete len:266 (+) Transcript_8126:1436-2233(+)
MSVCAPVSEVSWHSSALSTCGLCVDDNVVVDMFSHIDACACHMTPASAPDADVATMIICIAFLFADLWSHCLHGVLSTCCHGVILNCWHSALQKGMSLRRLWIVAELVRVGASCVTIPGGSLGMDLCSYLSIGGWMFSSRLCRYPRQNACPTTTCATHLFCCAHIRPVKALSTLIFVQTEVVAIHMSEFAVFVVLLERTINQFIFAVTISDDSFCLWSVTSRARCWHLWTRRCCGCGLLEWRMSTTGAANFVCVSVALPVKALAT